MLSITRELLRYEMSEEIKKSEIILAEFSPREATKITLEMILALQKQQARAEKLMEIVEHDKCLKQSKEYEGLLSLLHALTDSLQICTLRHEREK